MIKAVIFDFFGVLVTEGFKQFRENHFAQDKQKEQQALDLINRVDSGLMKTREFAIQLADLAGISINEVRQELGNNKPNKALINFISEQLKGHYKLGILSNSSENYPAQLLEREDLELFDDILLSYKQRVIKPQPEIYILAAERLGVQPSEVVFTDDSPGHSEGAKKTGMKSILYVSFPEFKKELEKLLPTGSNN